MSETLLGARGLGRRIGERWLWRNLDFTVARGERVGVVGPTGSGKSLLLRALAGLDPLDEGALEFAGRSVDPHAMPQHRARVMYLPQRPALVEGTVADNVRLVFSLRAHQRRRYEAVRVSSLFAELGRAPDFAAKAAQSLSGGEGQLVALVRALLAGPQVLLLDEPTAALDADTGRRVEALVHSWLAGGERACLWTSHDPEQIRRVATRTLRIGTEA